MGVAWNAVSFMSEAAHRGHPKHVLHGLPKDLCKKAVNRMSKCDLCMARTVELRRWLPEQESSINTQERSVELVDLINSILSASSCTQKELSFLKGRL